MLTKTRSFNNYLKFITPKISVYIQNLSTEAFIKYSTVGINRDELNAFESKLLENEIRDTPIFNPNLMKLFLNEVEIYNSKSILECEYKKSLVKHTNYISSLNDIVESSVSPLPQLNINFDENEIIFSKNYSIIFDRLYLESTYSLEFEGDFDSSKITCQIEELYLETNKEYLSCYWRYGNKHFNFISDNGLTKNDVYILSTSSERFNIRII